MIIIIAYIIAILVVAVLVLVWKVVKLSRRNLWQSNEIVELNNVIEYEGKITNRKFREVSELVKAKNRLQNQLNELKGEYAKELKKLKSENNVLLAKVTFLESANEEAVKRKESRYKKGEFIKEIEKIISQKTKPFAYSQMIETFGYSQSSLTGALSSLIKQGKVKRIKKGWYKWNKTNNDFPDFPVK